MSVDIYSAKNVKGHTPFKTMHFNFQQNVWAYADIGSQKSLFLTNNN